MNNRTIIVFDFETSNKSNKICEIVQVAALAINPATLEQIEGGEFNSLMRPLDWDVFDDDTIAIHKKTREELSKAPHPEVVWGRFAAFCRQYTTGAQINMFTLPTPAGHNMIGYDLPIVQRYCQKYGPTRDDDDGQKEQAIFSPLFKYDTLHLAQYWMWDRPELGKFSLDKLRRFFRMPKESVDNAHDAFQDVRDTAAILKKFLDLPRRVAGKVVWEGCFDEEFVAAELKRRKEIEDKKKQAKRKRH